MHYELDNLNWHAVGDHCDKASVTLTRDDTAPNPASTKHLIYGPADVTYYRFPSGIDVHVDQHAISYSVAHTKDERGRDRYFVEDDNADWVEGPFDTYAEAAEMMAEMA